MIFQDFCCIPVFAGSTGGTNKRLLTRYKNNLAYQNAFILFMEDALHRYKIAGLPETCDNRVFLQSLLWYGCVALYEKDGAILSLPACPTDGINIYGNSVNAYVYTRNGLFNKKIRVNIPGEEEDKVVTRSIFDNSGKKAEGVLIYETLSRYPFIRYVMQYAEAFADTMRTLDVARKNIKTPYIITAEENIIPTIRKYFQDRDENEEQIIVDTGVFPVDKVNILPIQVTGENITTCTQLIEWYRAQFKELCAFKVNTQLDKKGENLTTQEIHSNDDYISKRREETIECLQESIDNANNFFGLNITIEEEEQENENETNDIQKIQGADSDISGVHNE